MTRSATSIMFFLRTAATVMTLALGVAACHVDGTPTEVRATVGPEGGTANGPDGVQVVIPAGALTQPTTIGIARSAAGAPALPEDITPAGSVYEFTPHDVIFNAPVTIRMPVPANATSAEALMASPGGDWQVQEATLVTSQVAEWQRNNFSWGVYGYGCNPINSAPYSSSNPDPYPCWVGPSGGTNASATPASAITRTAYAWPEGRIGSAGSWTVNQASTVHLTVRYSAVPDCENPRLLLSRLKNYLPLGDPERFKVLFDQPVTITPTTLPGPLGSGFTYVRAIGSTTIDVTFSHLDNTTNVYGTTAFGSSFSCNRPQRSTKSGGDWSTFAVSIPAPTAFYTIGGMVNGLTGTGLVLQNNGGGDTPINANAVGFTFATSVGAGSPYNVTVLTQPTGQTCTVTNSGGTANANVTNVAISCVMVVTHTIGGNVTGLTGTGLVLRNNGGDNRAISANGGFTFATPISAGSSYNVTVLTQPTGQTCTVQNGSGTVNANVTNVAVSCVVLILSSWGSPLAVTAAGVTIGEPALGAASDGYTTLAWVQYDTDQYNGYASRFNHATGVWQANELIENFNTDTAQSLSAGVYSPRVAMHANQRAHIMFGYTPGGLTYQAAMSFYTGSAWQSNFLTLGSTSSQELAFTGDGNTALMMYSQHDGARYAMKSQAYRYDTNVVATLSPETGSSNGGGGAGSPAVASLGSNDAVSAWRGGNEIFVNRFNGSAQTWGTALSLNPGFGGSSYPSAVAGNAGGTATVVWLELNNGYSVYASRLSGTTWSTPVALATAAGGAISNIDSDVQSVATAVDTNGNAFFAWVQADTSGRHVVVRRCPAGQAMTACETAVKMDTRTETVGAPRMVVAPNGEVTVTWVSSVAGVTEIRSSSLSANAWSLAASVGAVLNFNGTPAIAVDGFNRVTLAWVGTDRRIYVARKQ